MIKLKAEKKIYAYLTRIYFGFTYQRKVFHHLSLFTFLAVRPHLKFFQFLWLKTLDLIKNKSCNWSMINF